MGSLRCDVVNDYSQSLTCIQVSLCQCQSLFMFQKARSFVTSHLLGVAFTTVYASQTPPPPRHNLLLTRFYVVTLAQTCMYYRAYSNDPCSIKFLVCSAYARWSISHTISSHHQVALLWYTHICSSTLTLMSIFQPKGPSAPPNSSLSRMIT
jgi:hypothetical protein